MLKSTDDLRITNIKPLTTPIEVMRQHPRTDVATRTVIATRHAFHNILTHADDRLAVIVGPCSIHDPLAAMDYAQRLATLRNRLHDRLEIIMRVYFEKPRTTLGWKGLINDPDLNGSFNIDHGLHTARALLLDINNLGLPAACEFLDMATPQYIADLVSWAAIGARTTESQIHRELASGLSCPVGFKNGTDGNVKIALDAVLSAAQPHHFTAATKDGHIAIAATTGNKDCHIILRGGKIPNYDAASIDAVATATQEVGVLPAIMIDASHANASKKPENQTYVLADIGNQIAAGDKRIIGVMLESNIVAGRQNLIPGHELVYGQSITDGCIDWDTTVTVLEALAVSVERRREVTRQAIA